MKKINWEKLTSTKLRIVSEGTFLMETKIVNTFFFGGVSQKQYDGSGYA